MRKNHLHTSQQFATAGPLMLRAQVQNKTMRRAPQRVWRMEGRFAKGCSVYFDKTKRCLRVAA